MVGSSILKCHIPTGNWSHQAPTCLCSLLHWKCSLSSGIPAAHSPCLLSMCILRTRSLYLISRLQNSRAERMTALCCLFTFANTNVISLTVGSGNNGSGGCRWSQHCDVHFVHGSFSAYRDSLPSVIVCNFCFVICIGFSLSVIL